MVVGVLAAVVIAGCASDGDSGEDGTGGDPPIPGTKPVVAEKFCDELATIACESHASCCSTAESGEWPGADGETSAGGSSGAPSCTTEQLALCRATIGKLVTDPRTGYSEARGGEALARVRASADACFENPVHYSDLSKMFQGSGEAGASCTPEDGSLAALRVSALSCKTGTACRLYLKADGAPMGVCEARADSSCSHPFDCGSGEWCDLPGDWKPGVWGECHPLRSDGWNCSSDLQCASNYCDAASKCVPDNERRFCLRTPYGGEVKADQPLLYLRLGETSSSTASDASGNGHAGTLFGSPSSTSPGALLDDTDAAIAFDGLDDHVSVAAGTLANPASLTLELWVMLPEGAVSQTLLAFGDSSVGGPVVEIDAAGSLQVNLADTSGVSHVLNSKDTHPQPNSWQHVVATYDGLHGELYLNGSKVAELDEAFVPRTSGELHIGYSSLGTYLSGSIDEVALYGSALSKGRTLEHYAIATQGPDRTWPLFRWFN
jgi:hypothetical protein